MEFVNTIRTHNKPSYSNVHTPNTGDQMVQTNHNLPDHDQQRCYCHAPTVKPEAANAVINP
jgi:hypothetical protein